MILLDLPDYATLDSLEADEAARVLGHRAGEWMTGDRSRSVPRSIFPR